MDGFSPAVGGAGYLKAKSFEIAYTTSAMGAAVAIAAGAYYVVATTDTWVSLRGGTTASLIAAAPSTTQPADGSENFAFFCPASTPMPMDVTAGSQFISAIAPSGGSSGSLRISGPVHATAVK